MPAFLIDAQLPRSLCAKVHALGFIAQHISELALADASDDIVWIIASERKFVIVSKDEDFARRVVAGQSGPAVVWVRLGNGPNLALWTSLSLKWPEICAALDAGERLVEIV